MVLLNQGEGKDLEMSRRLKKRHPIEMKALGVLVQNVMFKNHCSPWRLKTVKKAKRGKK